MHALERSATQGGMERTEIFELRTEAEVDEFCRLLRETKQLGPKSVRYTLALTVTRAAKLRELYDEAEERRGPLEWGFRRLVIP